MTRRRLLKAHAALLTLGLLGLTLQASPSASSAGTTVVGSGGGFSENAISLFGAASEVEMATKVADAVGAPAGSVAFVAREGNEAA